MKGSYVNTGSQEPAFRITAGGTYTIYNEANITAEGCLVSGNSAGNTAVQFVQNRGNVEAKNGIILMLYSNDDTICLNGGSIKGNARGNGVNGQAEITGGEWNGQLYNIKKVDIRGGNIHYEGNTPYAAAAIDSCEEVSISGGEIYAKNTNTAGKACAIEISKQTKLTLAGNIDMSAETGDRNGSIYFDMGESYTCLLYTSDAADE